jgi:lysozyme family protein
MTGQGLARLSGLRESGAIEQNADLVPAKKPPETKPPLAFVNAAAYAAAGMICRGAD